MIYILISRFTWILCVNGILFYLYYVYSNISNVAYTMSLNKQTIKCPFHFLVTINLIT